MLDASRENLLAVDNERQDLGLVGQDFMRRGLAAEFLDRRVGNLAIRQGLGPILSAPWRQISIESRNLPLRAFSTPPVRLTPTTCAKRFCASASTLSASAARKRSGRSRSLSARASRPSRLSRNIIQFAMMRAKLRSDMATKSGTAVMRKEVVSWPPRLFDVMAILSR